MRKVSIINKFAAIFLIPAFLFAVSCTPQQVNTAKDVLSKVSFYSALAKSLVQVAETQFPDNPKVKTALEATKASINTLESVVALVGAGIEKNEDKIIIAVADLAGKIFNLIKAIEDARKIKEAAKTSTSAVK